MIRKEEYENAHERALRIMKVMPGSPAEKSGIIPEEDYLLGIINFAYKDINDLCGFLDLLSECDVKTLEMCLYNRSTEKIRYVYLLPNKNWGGGGYLGCEFGIGYLNQLPQYQHRAPEQSYEEKLDREDEFNLSPTAQNINTFQREYQISP